MGAGGVIAAILGGAGLAFVLTRRKAAPAPSGSACDALKDVDPRAYAVCVAAGAAGGAIEWLQDKLGDDYGPITPDYAKADAQNRALNGEVARPMIPALQNCTGPLLGTMFTRRYGAGGTNNAIGLEPFKEGPTWETRQEVPASAAPGRYGRSGPVWQGRGSRTGKGAGKEDTRAFRPLQGSVLEFKNGCVPFRGHDGFDKCAPGTTDMYASGGPNSSDTGHPGQTYMHGHAARGQTTWGNQAPLFPNGIGIVRGDAFTGVFKQTGSCAFPLPIPAGGLGGFYRGAPFVCPAGTEPDFHAEDKRTGGPYTPKCYPVTGPIPGTEPPPPTGGQSPGQGGVIVGDAPAPAPAGSGSWQLINGRQKWVPA